MWWFLQGGAYGSASLPQPGAGAALQAQAQGYGSLYMAGGQQGLQSASPFSGMPGSVGGMQSFQTHPGTNLLGRQGSRSSSWDQTGRISQDGQTGTSSSVRRFPRLSPVFLFPRSRHAMPTRSDS